LVVNKCDTIDHDRNIYQYSELGFENVIPISALNGRLTGDLLDFIISKLDFVTIDQDSQVDESLRIAIVGMPNVGKSSLTNALLQREQTIVTPIAGTTRDSVDTDLLWYGKKITLVDTAGLRKKAKVTESVEYYSSLRTQKAINSADLVIVIIDAVKGFGHHDKAIITNSIREGKGILIVVNKWDLIEKETNTSRDFEIDLIENFKSMHDYPIIFVSAKTKQRISKIMDIAWNIYLARQQKISTKVLNQWLERTIAGHPPPATKGKIIKIKFISQVSTAPPVFVFFCNYPKMIQISYRRFLENALRKTFNFNGVPLKFSFRKK
jgi:GTP-binding protein